MDFEQLKTVRSDLVKARKERPALGPSPEETRLDNGHPDWDVQRAEYSFRLELRKAFEAGTKELFGTVPGLMSFGWLQYSQPYDDCLYYRENFSAYGVYDYEINDGCRYCGKRFKDVPVNTTEARKAVSAFMDNFCDEDLYQLFGDHVHVMVTKDAVELKAYDPDN